MMISASTTTIASARALLPRLSKSAHPSDFHCEVRQKYVGFWFWVQWRQGLRFHRKGKCEVMVGPCLANALSLLPSAEMLGFLGRRSWIPAFAGMTGCQDLDLALTQPRSPPTHCYLRQFSAIYALQSPYPVTAFTNPYQWSKLP